jgi:hypothetical protein
MNEEGTNAAADTLNNPQGGGAILLDERMALGLIEVST